MPKIPSEEVVVKRFLRIRAEGAEKQLRKIKKLFSTHGKVVELRYNYSDPERRNVADEVITEIKKLVEKITG